MTRRRPLLHVLLVTACLASTFSVSGQETRPAGVGDVTGTALGIGPTASSPPVPLTGLALVLVPRSEALLDSLERVKRQSRDSMTAYRTAMPEMQQIFEGFLQTLKDATDVQVIPRTTVDNMGRFALGGVPAGRWILVGRRALHVDRQFKDTRKETGIYQAQPRLVGYERVMVWLQPVTVEPGVGLAVELTDRNVWFEGVEEKTAARNRTGTKPSRRSEY